MVEAPYKPADTLEFKWTVPPELNIPEEKLQLRLDFFEQAVEMTVIEGDTSEKRIVSAMDISMALARELTFYSGLLPPETLWWGNTKAGPIAAIYERPRIRILSFEPRAGEPPKRYKIPLPGLIFICAAGAPPWVYAVKGKPTKESDIIYNAPLANIFDNGRSCPGNHKYPERIADIPDSFFISYFSAEGSRKNRSLRYPHNVLDLWDYLLTKKRYPDEDLVKIGTIKDLLSMELR